MPRSYKELEADELVDLANASKMGANELELAARFDLARRSVKTALKNTAGLDETAIRLMVSGWHKYRRIFKYVFFEKMKASGSTSGDLRFTTQDIALAQSVLGLVGGNPYDLKYNAKGRGALPAEVQATAAPGKEWRIVPVGKGLYDFRLFDEGSGIFELSEDAPRIKIPNAVPAMIERYAGDDEQALLAKVRYNGLVTAFLGISAYSLQSHWKTTLRASGSPVEIDELYVGLDSDGRHHIIAVEAKGRSKAEKITSEQLLSNYEAASSKFPGLLIQVVAAKVVDDHTLAMILFDIDPATSDVVKAKERHYVLANNPASLGVPSPVLSAEEIRSYSAVVDQELDQPT